MKIATLLKQVPSRESKLQLSSDQCWIDETTVDFELNESDAYALEMALQVKDKFAETTEVIVISMGPDRIDKILRDALAKGADSAIRVDNASSASLSDPLTIAGTLGEALKTEAYDLLLTGLQSDDLGLGQTGIILGELMGMSTASLVTAMEIKNESIRVKQELESGWFQWLTMPLPACLTIQTGANQPRYPTIKGIMGAKKKAIKVLQSSDLQTAELLAASPFLQLRQLVVQRKQKHSQMIEASPEQTVAKLVELIKSEVTAN